MRNPTAIRRSAFEYLGLALVLAALVTFFSFATGHFFTGATLRTIANQVPDAIFLAVAMTYVLIIAGIDLSVGPQGARSPPCGARCKGLLCHRTASV